MPRQITRVELRKVPMRGAASRGVSVVKNERGAALLETAVTLPIVLMICVGVFEFGRAYQTWQLLTNAAREGARVAAAAVVLHDVPPHTTVAGVPAKVIGRSAGTPAFNLDQMFGGHGAGI